MTERERRIRLKSLFDQLHLSNINEEEFRLVLSLKQYEDFIDKILDEIIEHQYALGLRK